jgi:hypothetical protein
MKKVIEFIIFLLNHQYYIGVDGINCYKPVLRDHGQTVALDK